MQDEKSSFTMAKVATIVNDENYDSCLLVDLCDGNRVSGHIVFIDCKQKVIIDSKRNK